jgi:PAS domain S-box-containing protein
MISSSDILRASILIVDDQEAHSSLLEQTLRGAGYISITTTNNPREVSELYRKNRYALILLDLQMPDLDGFQVMEALKEIETSGYLPVLVLTAQPDHKLRALKAGAKDFISKPFDLAEVLMRVHNMLEVRLLHEEAEMRTKQAEASERGMRTSELSYRRLFEAAQDGILTLDVETGRITDVNPFLIKLLGFSHSEIVGKTVGELSPFKDIESNRAMLERLQRDKYVRYEDLPLETKDGRHIDVEFVSNVYQAGEKNVIQCNVRDMTAQHRMEEALQESETKFRTLFEVANDAIFLLHNGGYVDCNAKGLERFGAARSQLIGQSPSRFSPLNQPDGRNSQEKSIELMQWALAGEPQFFEWVHQRLDGTQVHSDIGLSRFELHGEPYLQSIARDITERKRTEEQLLWKTAFFEAQIYSALDGILVVDGEGRKILQNQRMADLWNIPEEFAKDVDDRKQFEWVTKQIKNSRQFVEKVAHLHANPDEISRDEIELLDARVFDRYSSPVRDKDGKSYGRIWSFRDITESKRAEKERLQVGRQMELLLESAVEGIYGVDLEGRCTFINRAATEMLGCKVEQAMGRNMHDLKHLRRKDGSVYPFEECPTFLALRNQESAHVDDEIFWRADGTSFPVEYDSRPIFEDATVTGAVVTFTDITERKKAEEIMRGASKTEKGRQAKKVIRDLGVIAALSVLLFVACYELGLSNESFNYIESHEEGAGTFLDELIFTLVFFCLGMLVFSYRRWKESQAETVSQTQVTKALSLLHGEMETRVQQRTAELVNSNEALHTEMTKRKRATEQIAEQAALLDKTQDAILVRDLEGKILFWNKGAERLYGWTQEEAVGQKIIHLYHPNLKKFEEANALTISQGEWHGECQHFTKDRREVTIEGRWTLIRDHEGHPKSVLAINTDITERKKIEVQFMRAQRMESIGTLAGGVAHDLNNILAPIILSIDLLKLSTDDPNAKTILETIEVSAKRGSDIVRQVLSFARGVEGERTEVQPKHLLKDLEIIIKDTFPKDIRLQFSVPSDTWTILGDPTQVHQILLNLCVNARDAMPNGGSLKINVENCVLDEQYAAMNIQAKAGPYVNISVTDSGTGMPPGIMDKIFEPFFTTKELNKGTGLGLSTVSAIVKSHEGVINVYSEPGKGTTFNVYLPAMKVSSEARKEQAEEASLPRGNGETILLVDDEASILIITSQTLQAFGYRVLTATDGAEAVAIYAQHRHEISVVLTDMMMPIMDGSATIRALTKIDPEVKIIAASGLNTNGEAAKVSGLGIKRFLTKPYTAGTLLKAMRAILDEA